MHVPNESGKQRTNHDRPLRDPRLDLLRGLALWVMFVDHVDVALQINTLSALTIHAYFLFDAAEVFVFVSGLACGISFQHRLDRFGFAACQWHATKRAFRLYVVNLALLLSVLLFCYGVTKTIGASFAGYHFPALPLDYKNAALCIVGMLYQPIGFDLLIMYMQFVFLAPICLVIWRRSKLLGLAIAVTCYGVAQCYRQFNYPQWPPTDGSWTTPRTFNHFAWNALFIVGLYLGASQRNQTLPQLGKDFKRMLLVVSLSIVASLLWLGKPGLESFGFGLHPFWLVKTTLGFLRLVDFFAAMVVLDCLISTELVAKYRWFLTPLLVCGRRSLVAFALLQWLTFAAELYSVLVGKSPWDILLWDVDSLAVVVVVCFVPDRNRARDVAKDALPIRNATAR